MNSSKPLKIGFIALVLLITVSIDSVRNLPSTALFGPSLIFLYLVSALFMLIPGSIAVSELAHSWPEKGGIYQWISLAMGKDVGFFAVWGQWINTVIWLPTILSFLAGSAAFLLAPQLATNPIVILLGTLLCFWILTLLALFGYKTSSKISAFFAVIGLILPMGFVIILSIIWMAHGKPLQIHFTQQNLLPSFKSLNDWFSLIAIMTSFAGFELVAVYMRNITNAKKNYPRAMMMAMVIVLFTMIMGSLAIAIIIPSNSIVFTAGVAQAFGAFLDAYHLGFLLPLLVVLMVLGLFGEIINWVTSPARGLFQASCDGYFAESFHKPNRFGAEKNVLLLQAVIVSIMSLVFVLIPTVNGAYWFLTNLSIEIYMVVYFLLFLAAMVVEFKYPHRARLFKLLKPRSVILFVYSLGLIGCVATIIVGAFPPTTINIGSPAKYQLYFWLGMMVCMLPLIPLYIYQRRRIMHPAWHAIKQRIAEKIEKLHL
jgi:amino acid transporter